MSSYADRLRERILESHVSIHAFCRAHPELKRATVYMVLSGRYSGKTDVQLGTNRGCPVRGHLRRKRISIPPSLYTTKAKWLSVRRGVLYA